jgi:RND family efflux transporter MFP subunit
MLNFLSKYKYIALGLLVAAGLSYALYQVYLENSKPAVTVRTFTVERGDMEAQVSATGTISPVNSVNVSSKITGLIEKVYVEENQPVTEGDLLVVLDDSSIRAQVAQAQARLDNARINYIRKAQLANIGAIAMSELDQAKMDFEVAQASYDTVMSNKADTTIRAPLSGVVIGKPIPAGQTVSPGISTPMVLLTIADMSNMQIETKVDESDIGKILTGQKTSFTVDAYPGRNFSGTVSLISRQAITEQNVIYYRVMIYIDSPDGLLFPSMTARVSITTGESRNTLKVPLMAVRETRGVKTVQLMKNGESETVPVITGLSTDDRIEILEGLKEGDQIVLSQRQSSASSNPGLGMMIGGGGGGGGGGRR